MNYQRPYKVCLNQWFVFILANADHLNGAGSVSKLRQGSRVKVLQGRLVVDVGVKVFGGNEVM